MTTRVREDAERETFDSLEMIFLIELAKRKSYKENQEAMEGLFNLRREIEKTCAKHKNKEQYFGKEHYFGDENYFGEKDFFFGDEIITDYVFNFLQGVHDEPEFAIHDEKEIYKKLGAVLARAYRGRVNSVMVGLPYLRGFRLADFSCRNNILSLCAWWFYVSEETRRKEHSYAEIVYRRRRLPLREPRFFYTPCFEDKYFDLQRMNLDTGLNFLIYKNHSAKKVRNIDLMTLANLQIKRENLARGETYECKFADEYLITDAFQRVLAKKVTSIDYLIKGLICWDEMRDPSLRKNRSVDEVLRQVAKTISKVCGTAHTNQNTLSGYYERMSELINNYTPALLPWLPEFDRQLTLKKKRVASN